MKENTIPLGIMYKDIKWHAKRNARDTDLSYMQWLHKLTVDCTDYKSWAQLKNDYLKEINND